MGEADRRGRAFRREIAYAPGPSQLRFHLLESRYRGFSGPVGSGKTTAGAHEALKLAYLNAGCTGVIGSPSYRLLADTARATFLRILRENGVPYQFRGGEFNDVRLPECGSTVLFRTLSDPHSIIGWNLGWFWADELTFVPHESWKRLTERLRDKRARHKAGIGTWTPRGFCKVYENWIGPDRKHNYEAVLGRAFENAANLGEDYYEQLKHDLDERQYRQQVLGEYLNVFAGQAYFNFDRNANVRDGLDFDPSLPLHWSLDFNVDPMCSVICQVADVSTQRDRLLGRERTEIRVLDEIVLRDARTVHACKAFVERVEALRKRFYGSAFAKLYVYGDPAGTQRRTSASETDWQQVRTCLRDAGFETYWRVPDAHPAIRDRVAAVTAALLNAEGERALLFAPRCKFAIKDMEQVGWAKDGHGNPTGELAKTDPDLTHTSDAMGYLVHKLRKPTGGPRSGQIV